MPSARAKAARPLAPKTVSRTCRSRPDTPETSALSLERPDFAPIGLRAPKNPPDVRICARALDSRSQVRIM